MLRGVTPRPLIRVLCLTLIPDGGALTIALKQLGYTPYTLRSVFQQGRAKSHPMEWALLFNNNNNNNNNKEEEIKHESRVDMRLFNDHDAAIGPPAANIYNNILRECPEYTKVILVKENDKAAWAREYKTYVQPLLQLPSRRRGKSKLAKAFHTMITNIIPPYHQNNNNNNNNTVVETEKEIISALELYERQVRSQIPKSRLLVFHHSDGWGPLCTFLEREEPINVPFPNYDSGIRVVGNLQERIERTEKLTFVIFGIGCCVVLYIVYPALGPVQKYFKELYRDYKTTYSKQ